MHCKMLTDILFHFYQLWCLPAVKFLVNVDNSKFFELASKFTRLSVIFVDKTFLLLDGHTFSFLPYQHPSTSIIISMFRLPCCPYPWLECYKKSWTALNKPLAVVRWNTGQHLSNFTLHDASDCRIVGIGVNFPSQMNFGIGSVPSYSDITFALASRERRDEYVIPGNKWIHIWLN